MRKFDCINTLLPSGIFAKIRSHEPLEPQILNKHGYVMLVYINLIQYGRSVHTNDNAIYCTDALIFQEIAYGVESNMVGSKRLTVSTTSEPLRAKTSYR